MSRANAEDKTVLLEIWNGRIGEKEVARILECIDTYRVLDELQELQNGLMEEIDVLIEQLSIDENIEREGKQGIRDFVELIVTREK